MEILVKKGISYEAQYQDHDCDSHGSARRPRRPGRFRAGQVLAEIAERNRVLRLQGIRGLGGGLFRPDRRSAQGNRRQSDHDQGVQGRRSGQRPAFPGWLQDREAPVEAEEEHGGPPSSWMCQTSLPRLSSSKRTARDFRKAAAWETRCLTTKPHRTSSRPIPAPQTADTRAMWP